MAKVWSLGEAYSSLCLEKKEDIADFGGRFPIATALLAKMGSTSAAEKVFNALGSDCTMRKLESALKTDVKEAEESEEDEQVEQEEKKEAPVKAAKAKKEKAEPVKEPEEAEEADEDEQEDAGMDYAAMNAVKLFKECKRRGIEADPKKKSEVYIKLLKEDDAKSAEQDAEDDGWDDEEDEAPKKPAKASKPKKTEADDEDWDI